jgi:hypothetical protein
VDTGGHLLVDTWWWTLDGGHLVVDTSGHWWTLDDGHLVTLGGHSLVDNSELLVRHLVDT